MTTKEIVEYLDNYNKWRRWDEGIEQPNPIEIWKVINLAIGELELREGITDKIELYESAIGELRFANMRISHIMNVLDEIAEMTNDKLVKGIVKNAMERDSIDTMVHARNLFL